METKVFQTNKIKKLYIVGPRRGAAVVPCAEAYCASNPPRVIYGDRDVTEQQKVLDMHEMLAGSCNRQERY